MEEGGQMKQLQQMQVNRANSRVPSSFWTDRIILCVHAQLLYLQMWTEMPEHPLLQTCSSSSPLSNTPISWNRWKP